MQLSKPATQMSAAEVERERKHYLESTHPCVEGYEHRYVPEPDRIPGLTTRAIGTICPACAQPLHTHAEATPISFERRTRDVAKAFWGPRQAA